jgi:ubiquinone/menaquinone biosynthesis C-methylase UbiE
LRTTSRRRRPGTGPPFDIWIEHRDVLTEGIRRHGDRALALEPPREGDRVLDIGCGLGDTTVVTANTVGANSLFHALGAAMIRA